jgi:MFS family permease
MRSHPLHQCIHTRITSTSQSHTLHHCTACTHLCIHTYYPAGVLVRYLVPWLGEKFTMQIGLLGFALQCILIGFAQTPWMVFASMSGSMLSNLVYPSISSLVSKNVGGTAQGEVLGTINGVRALTGERVTF